MPQGVAVRAPDLGKYAPEQASVLDDPVTKAIRFLAQMIGASDPASQVMGLGMASLPMDEASRMARAKALGFNRPNTHARRMIEQFPRKDIIDEYGNRIDEWYHGTVGEEFAEFSNRPPKRQTGDPISKIGTHVSESPYTADTFTGLRYRGEGKAGGRILPLRVKAQRTKVFEFESDLREAIKEAGGPLRFKNKLAKEGYDSIQYGNVVEGRFGEPTLIVFQPSQLRSRFAAFDPSKSDSSNLLAGLGLVGAGLASANRRK